MTREADERIAELATGFALGELSDDELGELHTALKQPGESGQHSASIAWEVLTTCMDLRAEHGRAFLDSLRLRLQEDGSSGQFERGLLARLRASKPKLEAVSPPEAAQRSMRASMLFTVVAVALLLSIVIARNLMTKERVATITDIIGSATLAGTVLSSGGAVDRSSLVIPDGSQITVAWPDGGAVVIAGPANALAQTHGMSLSNGRAWIVSGVEPFLLGTPDRTRAIEIAPSTSAAIQIQSAHSVVGVASGSARVDGTTTVAAKQAIGSSGQPYPWTEQNIAGATGELAVTAGEWQWRCDLSWTAKDASLDISIACLGDRKATVHATPDGWSMQSGKQEIRNELSGPPLSVRPCLIRCDRGTLTVQLAGSESSVQLPTAVERFSWRASDTTRIERATFRAGPERSPPLPVAPGWAWRVTE